MDTFIYNEAFKEQLKKPSSLWRGELPEIACPERGWRSEI